MFLSNVLSGALFLDQDFTVRSILAKLRTSAHNLQIETGRFSKNKTPREERFCPYYKTLNIFTVEDEIHFLLSCSLFNAY